MTGCRRRHLTCKLYFFCAEMTAYYRSQLFTVPGIAVIVVCQSVCDANDLWSYR